MSEAKTKPTCFIAMPMTTTPEVAAQFTDPDHWKHVMESLFVPAIEAAGFEPITPEATGSDWIHANVIRQLSEADLVLVDVSNHNPNVFFEFGFRTSMNRPVAVVRAEGTSLPFDISAMNTPTYDPDLRPWSLPKEVEALAKHISEAARTCGGENPMWRIFGLKIKAEEPTAEESPEDARLELLTDNVAKLQQSVAELAIRSNSTRTLKSFITDPPPDSDPSWKVFNAAARAVTQAERDSRMWTVDRVRERHSLEAGILATVREAGRTADVVWLGKRVVVVFRDKDAMSDVHLQDAIRAQFHSRPWTPLFTVDESGDVNSAAARAVDQFVKGVS